MTANAMTSDREACLAAGMNDHVGKPFDLDHLVAVLLRQVGVVKGAGTTAPAGAAAQVTPETSLPPGVQEAAQLAGVDIAKALRRMGGKLGVYRRSLRDFVISLGEAPARLATQIERGELAEAARELHTLKGLAATLGAEALARAAAEAEQAFVVARPDGDSAQPLRLLPAMLAAMSAAEAALRSLGEALDGGPAVHRHAARPADPAVSDDPTTRSAALPALNALMRLLSQSDLGAVEAVQRLRDEHAALAGPRLDALVEAVDDLDFETALSQCDEWITSCSTP
jgi:HPt (histidine-containing phosphotransfer) domain-containing protein